MTAYEQGAKPVCILGGGISALSFAFFSGLRADLYEKEEKLGGLCRSFETNGLWWDIGPHIFFSKDKPTLDFMVKISDMQQGRRSNKIFYKGRLVKYPFENELSALPEADRDWCLNTFLNNPYATYDAPNMLMFFYKTFGEGITRAYLEPYNRKIWKFEPSFMDTQMVERIPAPPKEDVIASAKGIPTEGYVHQLYFYYPKVGGSQTMINAFAKMCEDRVSYNLNAPLERLTINPDSTFTVEAGGRKENYERLVSSIPIHELLPRISPAPPDDVMDALNALKYNSIHITMVNTKKENVGNNYAFMVPDPDISFHRLSKIDFLGDSYKGNGSSTLMLEITYRAGDRFDLPDDKITEMVVADLQKAGLCNREDVNWALTKSFKFAYVIYDLDHRKNTDKVLDWLKRVGITCVGRFSTFEYINTDAAVRCPSGRLRLLRALKPTIRPINCPTATAEGCYFDLNIGVPVPGSCQPPSS